MKETFRKIAGTPGLETLMHLEPFSSLLGDLGQVSGGGHV